MRKNTAGPILTFLAIFGIILISAEIISFYSIKKQESIIEKEVGNAKNQEIIFLGASHIAFGISENGGKIINVAARSEPFVFTLKKLQLLKPRIAVIGLNIQNIQKNSDHTFEDGLLNLPQYRYLARYLTEEEQQDIYALTDFETVAFYHTKTWIPFLGARLKKEPDSLLFGGWENWRNISVIDNFFIKKRYQNEFVRYNFQLSDFQIKYLRKILVYAQQHNIQIVFLSTPLHPDFVKLIPRQSFTRFHHVVQQLQLHYSFLYYNYTNFALPQTHFYDSDHLNGLGADVFTNHVLNRLSNDSLLKPKPGLNN
jgi:hypothetical protein